MRSPTSIRTRSLLFATAALLAAPPASAQQGHSSGSCGSKVTPAEAAQVLELQKIGMYELAAPPEYLLDVPVTFHAVRRSNGTGGLTDAELDENIPVLNASYLASGIQFHRPGPVIEIFSDFYYSQITTETQVNLLWQVGPVANTINIYFVESASNGGSGLCGKGSFTSSPVQGVLMDYDCTSSEGNPSTFTHELGHYFDLYHTHETTFGLECPSGSNCSVAGDLLCDTPADPKLSSSNTSGCTYTGTATRCGQTFNPQVANFMSYAEKPCRTVFTSAQRNRSLATLVNLRSNLIPGQLSGVVWVDLGYSGFEFGAYAFPFNSLAEGLSAASSGATLIFKGGGNSSPAVTITQAITLDTFRGTTTIGG
jgi:hypothetical protein